MPSGQNLTQTYFNWNDIVDCQSLDEATPPLSNLHKYVLLAIIVDRLTIPPPGIA